MKKQKCSGPLQARFFRTDGRVHDNSLLQYKTGHLHFHFMCVISDILNIMKNILTFLSNIFDKMPSQV